MSRIPAHLSGKEPGGIVAGEPIAQFEIGEMRNFVYLLIDWETRQCAIVDPQSNLGPLQQAMSRYQLKPIAVLLTHTHHDHIAGLPELVRLLPDLEVHLNESDLHRLRENVRNAAKIRLLKDGQKIRIGKTEIEVLHTPGHSPGECCYFIASETPYLFTGDTVFIRDCGRTDLSGGSVVDLFDSLQRIKALPQQTVILCGHHYQPECASTLAVELSQSPPLRARTVQELAELP